MIMKRILRCRHRRFCSTQMKLRVQKLGLKNSARGIFLKFCRSLLTKSVKNLNWNAKHLFSDRRACKKTWWQRVWKTCSKWKSTLLLKGWTRVLFKASILMYQRVAYSFNWNAKKELKRIRRTQGILKMTLIFN